MATGVKPRDEEISLTRSDLEAIQDAMKSKKFRDLFAAYCEEVRDPANQALYQKEMIQLEKERGYDITFINPKGGYVIKTSVAGDRKAFINICSNENVSKPSYVVQEVDGQKGMNWQIPYSLIPPREDFDHKRQRCVIYDVVFHPDTLRMTEVNQRFRDLVNKTAFDALQKTYNIHLDSKNLRYPKSQYKGLTTPAVIRKEDPNHKPTMEEETNDLSPETLDKLYPQHMYPEKTETKSDSNNIPQQPKRKQKMNNSKELCYESDNGYTLPKYTIKQQKSVDLQEFTLHKDSKQYSAIPNQLVVEINLPLLSSTKDCILDVKEKSLNLISDKPAKYKLDINLPYYVNDECGNAKFDKTKHLLIVTLPVIRKNLPSNDTNSLKIDSGVESEENSSSLSDDDNVKGNLIEELPSTSTESTLLQSEKNLKMEKEVFSDPTLAYLLPSYTHNVLDDTIAFTFHVKNTEPDSVKVKKDNNTVYIKFTSIGSGFVPIHYAAVIVFDDDVKFDNVSGEAWDNNVILQLELPSEVPHKFWIGLRKNDLVCGYFDMAHIKKSVKIDTDKSISNSQQLQEEVPVVEITNLGTETNIVVSSKSTEHDNDIESPISPKESVIIWKDSGNSETGAKSILRKPISMMRSFSESSVGEVASSMDYISSDCILEESSFKKTVRFNDVIARQFYRYNSSIEGQKKKNQRKKNKKRNQEMRKSESEAEDDNMTMPKTSKPRSVLKQRRDSGLADTSDADTECKNNSLEDLESCKGTDNKKSDSSNTIENGGHKSMLKIVDNNGNIKNESEQVIWKSETEPVNVSLSTKPKKFTPLTCDNIKHNTDLYNPDKLNKGQYLDISFKNDLIFDLDM